MRDVLVFERWFLRWDEIKYEMIKDGFWDEMVDERDEMVDKIEIEKWCEKMMRWNMGWSDKMIKWCWNKLIFSPHLQK